MTSLIVGPPEVSERPRRAHSPRRPRRARVRCASSRSRGLQASEADQDLPALRRATVAERRPAEAGVVVPGAAFEHALPVSELAAGPLEDVAHGVEHAVRACALEILTDWRRHSRPLRCAVESARIPGIAPGKDTTVRPARRLLPLCFARQAPSRIPPVAIGFRGRGADQHHRMIAPACGWTPPSP